jgi:DNA polymerase-3 subunit gamma/tau
MRDAQSAFDQVISFAGDKIKTEDVEKALGIAGADVLARVVNGIAENNAAEALAIVDDLVMRGHNLRNFCRDVLGHLRDLLVVKVSGDPRLLDSSSAQASTLQQQAALFTESDLVRFFHSLAETEASLKDAANPRYQVEVGLVKLMEMRRLASLADLIGRINELESALRNGQPPAERKSPQSAPDSDLGRKPARSAASAGSSQRATPSTASFVNDEPAAPAPSSLVDQIKSALERKKRRMLIAAVDAAGRVELEGDELVIEFTPDARHARDTLAKSDNAKALREACSEVCGRDIGIRFAIKDGASGSDAPLSLEEEERRSKKQTRQAAAQNPTVQQVLRAFGGEIVDIKTQ